MGFNFLIVELSLDGAGYRVLLPNGAVFEVDEGDIVRTCR